MSKRVFVAGALVAVAVVVAAGGLLASNMGFKGNLLLNGTSSSASGSNLLALPFNRRSTIDNASDLFFDIGDTTTVASVQRVIESTDTLQVYKGSGATAGPNFALARGEGYLIKLYSADVNYIVVGSHDPAFAARLEAPGDPVPEGGTSGTGTNIVAVPYHFMGVNASDLFFDIGTTATVASVQRLLNGTDTLQVYKGTGATAGPNFALGPGEAYVVKMQPGGLTDWVPSHY